MTGNHHDSEKNPVPQPVDEIVAIMVENMKANMNDPNFLNEKERVNQEAALHVLVIRGRKPIDSLTSAEKKLVLAKHDFFKQAGKKDLLLDEALLRELTKDLGE